MADEDDKKPSKSLYSIQSDLLGFTVQKADNISVEEERARIMQIKPRPFSYAPGASAIRTHKSVSKFSNGIFYLTLVAAVALLVAIPGELQPSDPDSSLVSKGGSQVRVLWRSGTKIATWDQHSVLKPHDRIEFAVTPAETSTAFVGTIDVLGPHRVPRVVYTAAVTDLKQATIVGEAFEITAPVSKEDIFVALCAMGTTAEAFLQEFNSLFAAEIADPLQFSKIDHRKTNRGCELRAFSI